MNLQDLYFIKTCEYAPEQYDVRLEDGTLVGYIRCRWDHIECHPYSLKTQEIKWKQMLYECTLDSISDDILVECGNKICQYHNELAFLNYLKDNYGFES